MVCDDLLSSHVLFFFVKVEMLEWHVGCSSCIIDTANRTCTTSETSFLSLTSTTATVLGHLRISIDLRLTRPSPHL